MRSATWTELARRAVASIADRAEPLSSNAVVWRTRLPAEETARLNRGVHAGSAGIAWLLAVFGRHVAIPPGLIAAAARGVLACAERSAQTAAGYFDGLASELDVLLELARARGDASLAARARWIARRGLARLERAPLPESVDLLGGLAGHLVATRRLQEIAGREAKPRPDLINAIGSRLILAPSGVAARTSGSVRPLPGLAHGASGVAYALRRARVSRVFARALARYELSMASRAGDGWPDLRAGSPRGLCVGTGWCNGSFGIAMAHRSDPSCDDVVHLASRHIRAEAASGRFEQVCLCHGMASTSHWLERYLARRLAPALERAVAERVASMLEPAADLGLFFGVAGPIATALSSTRSSCFPWLAPASRTPLSRERGEGILLDAFVEEAFPHASSSMGSAERATLLRALAAETSDVFATMKRAHPRVASALSRDEAVAAFRWGEPDDAAVSARALAERSSGHALRGAAPESLAGRRLVRSTRVRVMAGDPPTMLEHRGDRVEVVEVDAGVAELLARGSTPSTGASLLEHLRPASSASLHVIRGLVALGYLIVAKPPVTGEPIKMTEPLIERFQRIRTRVETAVSALGERVEAAWRKECYAESAFSPLATDLLREARLHEHFDTTDIYTWASLAQRLPPQLDAGSTFGEPPLTLYASERFVIDAYTWFSSTTSIHQHAFSGAFGVLRGGSVHTTYSFEEQDRINVRLQHGVLTPLRVEWLGQGDVREIRPKRGFIHSLFHLEHPSVSIVVRTNSDEEYNPQYAYLSPCVSYDPFFVHRFGRRKKEVLSALGRVSPERYAHVLTERLRGADLSSAFFLLNTAFWELLKRADLFAEVREAAADLFGERLTKFFLVWNGMLRERHLTNMRKKVTDPELRVFLALLLNVPSGAEIRRLVAERHPGKDADVLITSYVREIGALANLGFELDDIQRDVFALAVRGLALPDMLVELKRSYDDDDVERSAARIEHFVATVRAQPLIHPLFT